MLRIIRPAAFLLAIACLLPWPARKKRASFRVKPARPRRPTSLSEPIRKLLNNESIQFLDGAGKAVAEIWLRKEMPDRRDAGADQERHHLSRAETIGSVRRDPLRARLDRLCKQKIKAGVWTLRLAYQPTDGKHTSDVSEFQEFVVVLSPKTDTSAN